MEFLLRGLLFLAAATWIGGLVAVLVVVHAARVSLNDRERVVFFRALGRGYLRVLGTAGLVMLTLGAWALRDHPLDAAMFAALASAAALVFTLAAGVVQARRMTHLRQGAIDNSDEALTHQIARGAARAAALRTLVTILSLAVVAQGGLLLA